MLKSFLIILLLCVRHSLAAEVGHRAEGVRHATYEERRSCFDLKDPPAKHACFRKLAEAGDARSQWILGEQFEDGRDIGKDDAQSVYWYRKAAEQGEKEAQLALGRKLFRGNGVAKNVTEGLRWMSKAAELGATDAQLELGNIYDQGDGVSIDKVLAVKYLSMFVAKGKDKEASKAAYTIGRIYENGEGIGRDEAQAMIWYRRSAMFGNLDSGFALGRLLVKRKAASRDIENGMNRILDLALAGHREAIAYMDDVDKQWRKHNVLSGAKFGGRDRRVPVDLSKQDEQLLDAVALVGLDSATFRGSGFFVSACHLLTAHHVVFDQENDELSVIGKEVAVGVGQTHSKPWKLHRQVGKVVAFDPEQRTLGNNGLPFYNSGLDWALVKVDRSKDGTYMGEKVPPFCLFGDKSEIQTADQAKELALRLIGHPDDKYAETGKRQLWQDPDCEILNRGFGGNWLTNCQASPGMSGGPLAYYSEASKSGNSCWRPLGIISQIQGTTDGLVKRSENNPFMGNVSAPIDKKNYQKIKAAMDANPCN